MMLTWNSIRITPESGQRRELLKMVLSNITRIGIIEIVIPVGSICRHWQSPEAKKGTVVHYTTVECTDEPRTVTVKEA